MALDKKEPKAPSSICYTFTAKRPARFGDVVIRPSKLGQMVRDA